MRRASPSLLWKKAFQYMPIRRVVSSRKNFHTKQKATPLLSLDEAAIYKAEDIKSATHRAIHNINSLRSIFHDQKRLAILPTREQLLLLDSISNELCLIMDTAEFIRNTHENPDFQQAAEDSFALLSEMVTELNADRSLYQTLFTILNTPKIVETLSEEDREFAQGLLQDFQMAGIHFPDQELQQMKAYLQHETYLETTWNANILHHSPINNSTSSSSTSIGKNTTNNNNNFEFALNAKDFNLGPFLSTDLQQFQQLSKWLHQQYYLQPLSLQQKQTLLIPKDRSIMNRLSNTIHDESKRSQLWVHSHFTPFSNISILPKLIAQRHQTSQFLNFPNYNQRILRKNIAKNETVVDELLQEIAYKTHDYTKYELLELAYCKQEWQLERNNNNNNYNLFHKSKKFLQNSFFSNSSLSSLSSQQPHQQHRHRSEADYLASLQPWDIGYFTLHRSQFDLRSYYPPTLPSNNNNDYEDELEQQSIHNKFHEYFPLDHCLNKLYELTEHLFGIKIHVESMSPYNNNNNSESWVFNEHQDSLVKLRIIDTVNNNNNKDLGICYLDLFTRSNKFSGAAHFTVRCGCETVVLHPTPTTTNNSHNYIGYSQHSQLPIVVLVFPFAPPPHSHNNHNNRYKEDQYGRLSSSSNNNNNNQRNNNNNRYPTSYASKLLSYHELESLFHEFGHALHSLLSRTRYQHISGTRGPTDFIEIPSHIYEYFLQDKRFIKWLSKHYITGHSLPSSYNNNSGGGGPKGLNNNNNSAIDVQVQVLLAMTDQYLFAKGPSYLSSSHCNNNNHHHPNLQDDWQFYQHILSDIVQLQSQYTILPLAHLSQTQLHSYLFHSTPTTRMTSNELIQLPYIQLLSHRHLVGYGGSYYAYLYAKIIAAQIWEKFFGIPSINNNNSSDNHSLLPFCPDMGAYLRKELLQLGCSRNPQQVIQLLLNNRIQSNEKLQIDSGPYLRMLFPSR
jgi:Zn-dependent oligopeptidase